MVDRILTGFACILLPPVFAGLGCALIVSGVMFLSLFGKEPVDPLASIQEMSSCYNGDAAVQDGFLMCLGTPGFCVGLMFACALATKWNGRGHNEH
jgi:hypothetical protein